MPAVAEEIHAPAFMFPPRRNTPRECVGFLDDPDSRKALEARLARLDGSGINKRKAHVHTRADFALDDQQLITELRHQAESNPKPWAVVVRGRSDTIVADDDPDARVVLSQP
jgi:hypothetical protein